MPLSGREPGPQCARETGGLLTEDDLAAIDGLDTGVRGGPEPEAVTLETFGRPIPEA